MVFAVNCSPHALAPGSAWSYMMEPPHSRSLWMSRRPSAMAIARIVLS